MGFDLSILHMDMRNCDEFPPRLASPVMLTAFLEIQKITGSWIFESIQYLGWHCITTCSSTIEEANIRQIFVIL